MTPKQQYTAALNAIAKRYGYMENSTVDGILSMLRKARDEVIAQVATETAAGQVRLTELSRNLTRIIDEMEARAVSDMRSAVATASKDGALYVTQPLEKVGIRSGFLTPSESQLNTLLGMSAALVTGITDEIRSAVDIQIRRAALGQISNTQAMQNLTTIFGGQSVQQGRMVVSGISAKAERVVRTELQRVFNLSNHAQQLKTAQTVPGLLKRWIATADSRTRQSHLNAHVKYTANPIPVTEPFVLKTAGKPEVRVMYPSDPAGEPWETINCRCREATIHPHIGVIGSPLDGRIAAVIEKRAQESARIAAALYSVGRVREADNFNEAYRIMSGVLRGKS